MATTEIPELPPTFTIRVCGDKYSIYQNGEVFDGLKLMPRVTAVLACWALFNDDNPVWYEFLRTLGAPDISDFDLETWYW